MSAPFCYYEISFQDSCSCLQLFQSESSQLGYYEKIKNNNKTLRLKLHEVLSFPLVSGRPGHRSHRAEKTHKALTNIEGLWVWNVCTLKKKYDLMLCQSHSHTASETFVCQKENRIRLNLCIFASVTWLLIGKDGEYDKTEKHEKMSDSVWPLHSTP